ncbi:polysaccharide deacetylase family protein [Thiolapillus sp.]|uniref:polysaccharide deacetylase family protein n=1 Tax=Thiolapillus sp. TaxID=2017437 RepID=UPI0025FC6C39
MRIALKIDVPSFRAATVGVPNLLKLFEEYQISASFFFSVEYNAQGKGLVEKAVSLLGKRQKPEMTLQEGMLAVADAGHEIALMGFDASTWSKQAAFADADWTSHQLALGMETFEQLLGHAPNRFAAPGWQVNAHLLAMEERLEFRYASDVRGKYPFLPSLHNVVSQCPQIPTTLPTLSELLLQDDIDSDKAHEYLYAESRHVLPFGHVYSANAELEGIQHLEFMEKMLVMWKGQEGSLRTLGEIRRELEPEQLPVHQIGWGAVPGRREHLAMQSVKAET